MLFRSPLTPEIHVGPELDEEDEDDANIAESMMEEVEEEAETNPEEELVLESPSELYVSAPDMELKEAADLAHAINEPIEVKRELKSDIIKILHQLQHLTTRT